MRTVRALTQLTGQVAIVQYPSFARATVSHVELVQLGAGRMLVILVTDTGRVSQRLAFVRDEFDDDELARVRADVASLLVGKPVREGAQRVEERLAGEPTSPTPLSAATTAIVHVVAEELEEFRHDRLVMAGAANLARSESDFRGSIYPLLEAIEEQVTLMKLMSEMVADDHGLAASIGRENEPFGLGRGIRRRQRVRHDRRSCPRRRARPDAHGLPDELRGGPCRRALPHTDARRRRECPLTRHP